MLDFAANVFYFGDEISRYGIPFIPWSLQNPVSNTS